MSQFVIKGPPKSNYELWEKTKPTGEPKKKTPVQPVVKRQRPKYELWEKTKPTATPSKPPKQKAATVKPPKQKAATVKPPPSFDNWFSGQMKTGTTTEARGWRQGNFKEGGSLGNQRKALIARYRNMYNNRQVTPPTSAPPVLTPAGIKKRGQAIPAKTSVAGPPLSARDFVSRSAKPKKPVVKKPAGSTYKIFGKQRPAYADLLKQTKADRRYKQNTRGGRKWRTKRMAALAQLKASERADVVSAKRKSLQKKYESRAGGKNETIIVPPSMTGLEGDKVPLSKDVRARIASQRQRGLLPPKRPGDPRKLAAHVSGVEDRARAHIIALKVGAMTPKKRSAAGYGEDVDYTRHISDSTEVLRRVAEIRAAAKKPAKKKRRRRKNPANKPVNKPVNKPLSDKDRAWIDLQIKRDKAEDAADAAKKGGFVITLSKGEAPSRKARKGPDAPATVDAPCPSCKGFQKGPGGQSCTICKGLGWVSYKKEQLHKDKPDPTAKPRAEETVATTQSLRGIPDDMPRAHAIKGGFVITLTKADKTTKDYGPSQGWQRSGPRAYVTKDQVKPSAGYRRMARTVARKLIAADRSKWKNIDDVKSFYENKPKLVWRDGRFRRTKAATKSHHTVPTYEQVRRAYQHELSRFGGTEQDFIARYSRMKGHIFTSGLPTEKKYKARVSKWYIKKLRKENKRRKVESKKPGPVIRTELGLGPGSSTSWSSVVGIPPLFHTKKIRGKRKGRPQIKEPRAAASKVEQHPSLPALVVKKQKLAQKPAQKPPVATAKPKIRRAGSGPGKYKVRRRKHRSQRILKQRLGVVR